MKRSTFVFVVLAFLAAGVVLASTQEPAQAPAQAKEKTFSGRVGSVDTERNVLTVKNTGGEAGEMEMRFTIDAQTKIERAGEALKLADLQAGQQIIVKYLDSAGKNVAKHIDVKPAS